MHSKLLTAIGLLAITSGCTTSHSIQPDGTYKLAPGPGTPDNEFNGADASMRVDLELKISEDRKSIVLAHNMEATELGGNGTVCRRHPEDQITVIHTVEEGRILRIDSPHGRVSLASSSRIPENQFRHYPSRPAWLTGLVGRGDGGTSNDCESKDDVATHLSFPRIEFTTRP